MPQVLQLVSDCGLHDVWATMKVCRLCNWDGKAWTQCPACRLGEENERLRDELHNALRLLEVLRARVAAAARVLEHAIGEPLPEQPIGSCRLCGTMPPKHATDCMLVELLNRMKGLK
jgi:hypothetical protein